MYSILTNIHNLIKEELNSEDLQKIPNTTYQDVANYIKETRNLVDESNRDIISSLARRERAILSNLAVRLLNIRIEKVKTIVIEESNGVNLTSEEKYLIESSSLFRKRLNKLSRALVNGQTAVLSNVSQLISSRYVIVRFLKENSALIGVDLAKYGPFKKEDVASLPLDNVKPLLKQGIVQEIDADIP
ncbi:MAG TPA: hypothetical protein VIH27_00235 [Nitrososphaerales archaeon]